MALVIRKIELKDFADVISLIKNELGYDGISSEIYDRIMKIYESENYVTFVAEQGGRIIGFVGLMRGLAFELSGEYIRIIALAVKREYQNHGIGTRLAEKAEDYAYEIGASSIVISSGLKRADAHIFYSRIGYGKKGYSFIKMLCNDEQQSTHSDALTPIPPRRAYLDEEEMHGIGSDTNS